MPIAARFIAPIAMQVMGELQRATWLNLSSNIKSKIQFIRIYKSGRS